MFERFIKFIKFFTRFFKLLVYTAVGVVVIIFGIANNSKIVLSLYPLPLEIETRLFILMILFFTLGLIVGKWMNLLGSIRGMFTDIAKNKKLKECKKEAANLSKDRQKLQQTIEQQQKEIAALSEKKKDKGYF